MGFYFEKFDMWCTYDVVELQLQEEVSIGHSFSRHVGEVGQVKNELFELAI